MIVRKHIIYDDITLWYKLYRNVSCFYVIKDEDLKRTILGATLEWAVLVRSDKRIHSTPSPQWPTHP